MSKQDELNSVRNELLILVARINELEERPQEPEVLRPRDWHSHAGWYINKSGKLHTTQIINELFAGDKSDLEPIAKQLKTMSIIHRLKQAAGCGDWKFSEEKNNYFIYFNHHKNKYSIDFSCYHDCNMIYFPESHKDRIFEGFLAAVERGQV